MNLIYVTDQRSGKIKKAPEKIIFSDAVVGKWPNEIFSCSAAKK